MTIRVEGSSNYYLEDDPLKSGGLNNSNQRRIVISFKNKEIETKSDWIELQKKSKEIDKKAKQQLSKEEYAQYESLKYIADSKSYNTVREDVEKWNKKHPDLPIITQYYTEIPKVDNKPSATTTESSTATGSKDKPQKQYHYEMGKRENWVREIGTNSVTSAYNANNIYGLFTSSSNANGSIGYGGVGDFSQAHRGDCYLLAEIQAIKNTKNGQAILNKTVQQNADGSVTVTLPGAIAIKNNYINRGYGNKCAITGTYTITKAAMQKARQLSGKDYANGNVKVIALELAMETYRAEMRKTMDNIGHLTSEDYQHGTAQGSTQAIDNGDNLSAGFTWDAGFILTGQKSDTYWADKDTTNKRKLFDDHKYRRISEKQMNAELNSQTASKAYSGYSEVSSVTSANQMKFHQALDKYAGHEDEYAITFGVIVAKDGPDGKTIAGNGHALAIKKITKDNVYVQNPWHPNEIQVIPRREFEQMVTGLTAQKMSLADVNATYEKNQKESIKNNTAPKIPQRATKPEQILSQNSTILHINPSKPPRKPQKPQNTTQHNNLSAVLNFINTNNNNQTNITNLVNRINQLKTSKLNNKDRETLNNIMNLLDSSDNKNIDTKSIQQLLSLMDKYSD